MAEDKKEKSIDDLTKELEEYKKANEEKLKEIEDAHKKEVEDLKAKMLDRELNSGIETEEEEIPEEDKVVTWDDIKKEIKED